MAYKAVKSFRGEIPSLIAVYKTGDKLGAVTLGVILSILFAGRYLGLVGVIGLFARLVGWYKSWIWAWVVFVVIGFVSAAALERLQKQRPND